MLGKKSYILSWLIILILAFYAAFPLYILFIDSFKTRGEIFSAPLAFPKSVNLHNYVEAWNAAGLGEGMLNSSILALSATILTLFIGGIAAYGLTKNTKFNSVIITFLFLCTMLPSFLLIIPLYAWAKELHLTNLLGVVIISVGSGLPFSILLLRSFVIAIPRDLEEAALLDGANEWQIFWKIILPLSRSGFLTVGLLSFLGGWNSFMLPLTFLSNPHQFTAIIKIYTLSGRYTSPWGQIFAAIIITILPVAMLFLLFQRHFVKGLISGSIK